jgi:hypothetical protein
MKKIALQLTHDELCCFIAICERFVIENPDRLLKAILLEIAIQLSPKTFLYYKKRKAIRLTVPQSMAFSQAVSQVALDKFDPYSLAVVAPIYQTIGQQLCVNL